MSRAQSCTSMAAWPKSSLPDREVALVKEHGGIDKESHHKNFD